MGRKSDETNGRRPFSDLSLRQDAAAGHRNRRIEISARSRRLNARHCTTERRPTALLMRSPVLRAALHSPSFMCSGSPVGRRQHGDGRRCQTPFDPFPFPFLTLLVSLEAIFLSMFVLMSQNRMSRQADKRAHLDLQIDLLAEQELTTILRMLRALAAGREGTIPNEQMREQLKDTDIHSLASMLDSAFRSVTVSPRAWCRLVAGLRRDRRRPWRPSSWERRAASRASP